MVQSRRTSTTKYPAKQGLAELTESLKNIQQNQQAFAGITTAPAKPRRPPSQRANEMTVQSHKSHFKDSTFKRDRSSEPDDPDPMGKMMDKSGVRSVVSDSVYPGNRTLMIISLPTEEPKRSNPYLKTMVSSELVDNLESTSKEDLEFLDDGFSPCLPDVDNRFGCEWIWLFSCNCGICFIKTRWFRYCDFK